MTRASSPKSTVEIDAELAFLHVRHDAEVLATYPLSRDAR
jgi:hypothetical protein